MSVPSEPTILFDEDTANLEFWKLKQIADAAQELLPPTPGHHIFVKLDDFLSNRFLLTLVHTSELPLCVWEATLVDENQTPQLKRRLTKE